MLYRELFSNYAKARSRNRKKYCNHSSSSAWDEYILTKSKPYLLFHVHTCFQSTFTNIKDVFLYIATLSNNTLFHARLQANSLLYESPGRGKTVTRSTNSRDVAIVGEDCMCGAERNVRTTLRTASLFLPSRGFPTINNVARKPTGRMITDSTLPFQKSWRTALLLLHLRIIISISEVPQKCYAVRGVASCCFFSAVQVRRACRDLI